MYSVAYASSCPLEGSSGVLGPWRALGTLCMGSSVKLPLNHVDRDVECVGGQDHGYAEGVTIPKEGQQMIGASLGHVRGR